jgi:hypothetical protein
MRKTAFFEEQVAYALREVDAGTSVAEASWPEPEFWCTRRVKNRLRQAAQ